MRNIFFFLAVTCFFSYSALAVETNLKGFGSLIGTTLLGDEGYWVKHPSGAGFYDGDVGFELKEESFLALQGTITFSPRLSLTAQLLSRGQNSWDIDVEQFYLSYELTNQWNLKVGTLKNPVYLFSDSMDIHYSFAWLRTPGDAYSLSAIDFDGVSAMYVGEVAGLDNRTIFYYGKVDKNPDPFLTELFVNRGFNTAFTNGNVDADGSPFLLTEYRNEINDLFGISTEFYIDNFTVHLAFMEGGGDKGTNTYADGSTFTELNPTRDFYDLAVMYDDGNWFGIAEWNNFKDVYTSYYFTAGKYFNEWQVLLTYGDFEGEVRLPNGFVLPESDQEFDNTLALSARYDFASNMAFKIELIRFKNENSLIVTDRDGDGEINSTVLSVAIDFVF